MSRGRHCCTGGASRGLLPVSAKEIEVAKELELSDFIEKTTCECEFSVSDDMLFHEAAHAVAGAACGVAVETVSANPPCVKFDGVSKATLDAALIVRIAGNVAQDLFHRLVRRLSDEELQHFINNARADGHRCDECASVRAILKHHPDASDDDVMTIWRQHDVIAIDLVRDNWASIRAVADALKERGELSGDDVNDIIGTNLVRYTSK